MSYGYLEGNSTSDSDELQIDEDYDENLQSSSLSLISDVQEKSFDRRSVSFEVTNFSEFQIEEHKVYTVKSEKLKKKEKKVKRKEKRKKRKLEESNKHIKKIKEKVNLCIFPYDFL